MVILTSVILKRGSLEIIITDAVITKSEKSYYIQADLKIENANDYVQLEKNDDVQLIISSNVSETFELMITNKRRTRREKIGLDMSVFLASRTVQLDEPRSQKQTYYHSAAITAKTACKQAIQPYLDKYSVVLDWQAIDWLISGGTINFTDVTPIELVEKITAAIGATIQTKSNGDILVSPTYPINTNTYTSAAIPTNRRFIDQTDDLIEISESYEENSGCNNLRITNGAIKTNDSFTWDETKKLLRFYPDPWRDIVTIETTEEVDMAQIYYQGIVERDEEQKIEIKNGTGSISFPLYQLNSITWLSEELQNLTVNVGTKKITTDKNINEGYGIVTINYKVRTHDFIIETDNKIQVLSIL